MRELALRDADRVALQFSDAGALGVQDLAGLDEIHSGSQESQKHLGTRGGGAVRITGRSRVQN